MIRPNLTGYTGTLSSAKVTLFQTAAGCSAPINLKVARIVNHLPVIGKADGRTFDGITPWMTSPATGGGSGTYPLAIAEGLPDHWGQRPEPIPRHDGWAFVYRGARGPEGGDGADGGARRARFRARSGCGR